MNVQCSWKVPDGKPISDAIIWSDGVEGADLEDEVMIENCIMLEAPNKGEGAYPTSPACQLLFSSQPPFHISRISVLCEARVIEVYGHHGEYLKTIKNELLEEAEDMVVFRGDIILDRPLELCSIKFAGLRTSSEMWLYGVKVSWTKKETYMDSVVTIPLAAVEQRLAEMGLALSDKAEAFKQLVERCQKSPVCGQPDIGFFISTLQQCNLVKNKSPSPEIAQTLSESLDNLTKCIESRDSQNNFKDVLKSNTSVYQDASKNTAPAQCSMTSAATSSLLRERCTTSSQTDEEYLNVEGKIKAHIDEQLQDLDKKIWDKINQRLQDFDEKMWGRINQRFQEIETKLMCKLDEIESFVKPQGVAST